MRLPVLVSVAVVLAGCGSSSSGDSDRLADSLGKHATMVQRIDERKTATTDALNKHTPAVVTEFNAVVEHLLAGPVSQTDRQRLQRFIADPDAAWQPVQDLIARADEWSSQLERSGLTADETADSPGSVKRLARDWNAYVGEVRRDTDAFGALLRSGLELRGPSQTFLRASAGALARHDEGALAAARRHYRASLRSRNFQASVEATKKRVGVGSDRAFDRLVDSVNASGTTRDLVADIRRRYPASVFAKRFHKRPPA